MPVSAEEYQRLIQREMKRYRGDPRGGPERDKAVRSANIAAGYGNSTALKHPARTRDGQVQRGDGKGDRDTPTPKPRPEENVPRPKRRPSADVPYQQRKPEPSQGFPPDLAVSPRRDRMDWEGATGGDHSGFPPDLAVSPPHERWPGATSGPPAVVQVLPAVPNPGLMGVPPALRGGGGGPQAMSMSDLLSVLAGGGPQRFMPPGWGM